MGFACVVLAVNCLLCSPSKNEWVHLGRTDVVFCGTNSWGGTGELCSVPVAQLE